MRVGERFSYPRLGLFADDTREPAVNVVRVLCFPEVRMPRRARLLLPGIPLHFTQRGVNRGAVFVDGEDRGHYLQLLQRACQDHAVALHAYVLIGNHVHLLMTSNEAGAVSEALRWLGPAMCEL